MAFLYLFGNSTLNNNDGFKITAPALALTDFFVKRLIEIIVKSNAKPMYKIPYSPVIDATRIITSRATIEPMTASLFIIPFAHNS